VERKRVLEAELPGKLGDEEGGIEVDEMVCRAEEDCAEERGSREEDDGGRRGGGRAVPRGGEGGGRGEGGGGGEGGGIGKDRAEVNIEMKIIEMIDSDSKRPFMSRQDVSKCERCHLPLCWHALNMLQQPG
jgi:hypothetical protein